MARPKAQRARVAQRLRAHVSEPAVGTDTMALVKDQYVVQDSFLPPAIKGFLEGFQFGRFGLRAGRKMVRAMQAVRLQRKLWMRQFGLPLRNAMLFNQDKADM